MSPLGASTDRAPTDHGRRPVSPVSWSANFPLCQEEGLLSAKLVISPGRVFTWKEFKEKAPRHSIALDGVVCDITDFDTESGHGNVNHHEGVEGLFTRSTSGQIAILLKQRFLDDFFKAEVRKLTIYLNHPDQDSALASWLLMNSEQLLNPAVESRLESLIALEGRIDASCGLYHIEDLGSDLYKEMIWVFEPYTDARARGRLGKMGALDMADIVKDIHFRLGEFCRNKAEKRDPDLRYEEMGGGPGWSMVRETGAHCRAVFLRDGIKAFVSYLGESEGRYFYAICKATPLVSFPIPRLYEALNKFEGILDENTNRWNGSKIGGGSPRGLGSKLAPEELIDAINQCLTRSLP